MLLFRFLNSIGKQNILDFFNENALRVRVEILEVLVTDVMAIETDFIKIKDELYDIGKFFYKDVLLMLDNGVGVMRKDGTASRFNVHALNKFAMENFGWGGKNIVDVYNSKLNEESKTTPRKTTGSKAAPAASIFELFRWSEAVFRIKHGPLAQSKIVIGDFVKAEIERAYKRKHALSLSARILKRRIISGVEEEETKKVEKQPKKVKSKKSTNKTNKITKKQLKALQALNNDEQSFLQTLDNVHGDEQSFLQAINDDLSMEFDFDNEPLPPSLLIGNKNM